jgi:hypothetical protein
MPLWAVWIALGVSIAVAVAAIARFIVVVLRAWRDLKRSRGALFGELDRVAAAGEALGETAAALGGGSERLSAATSRLAVSRTRLAVLQSALGEATDAVGRVTAVYPRK